MRENIGLYRGKRIDNDEWVEGWYYKRIVHLNTFHQNVVVDAIEVYDGENPLSIAYYNVYPETVGQYTATDKNGKKIFEGDICDFSISGNDHTTVVISIKNAAVGFEPVNYSEVAPEDRRWRSIWRDNEETLWDSEYFCVIGNIHDNPDAFVSGVVLELAADE